MSVDHRTWVLSVSAAVALAGASAAADPPEKAFAELFGAEAERVSASASKADDLAFASKLIRAAGTLTDAPDLRICLYTKAFDFALRSPNGFAVAEQSLALLNDASPGRKLDWEEKRLELYLLRYRGSQGSAKRPAGESYVTQCIVVADAKGASGRWSEAAELYQRAVTTATYIRSLQKDLAAKKLALATRMKQAEALAERIRREPENAAARTALIRLYLEVGNPVAAERFLDPVVGEAYRTYVPLAGKVPDALPARLCMEMGDWFRTLAFTATGEARDALAARAKAYYRAYLRSARRDGASREALGAALQRINSVLAQMGQSKIAMGTAFAHPQTREAFDKAVAWLLGQQASDGSWKVYKSSIASSSDGQYNTRSTATVLLALLEGGRRLSDERLAKALRYLGLYATSQTEGLAFRCMVWVHGHRQLGGPYFKALQVDVRSLLTATRTGGYYSTVTSTASGYNQHSWSPPLGVDAGAALNLKVPAKYWKTILGYWAKQQKSDGGWAYRADSTSTVSSYGKSSCTWTTMGLGATAVSLKNLYGAEAVKRLAGADFAPLRKGLGWMDTNLQSLVNLKDGADTYGSGSYSAGYVTLYDTLYVLSRVGLLTGRRKLGQVDWAVAGTQYLVNTQETNGSWGGLIPTARALLFLLNAQKAQAAGLSGSGPILAPLPVPPAPTPKPKPPAPAPAAKDAWDRVTLMEQRLKAKPDSVSLAKELVRLYVVELREFDFAAEYVGRIGRSDGPELLKWVRKGVADLDAPACLRLADWLMELADGSSPAGRKFAYSKAQACYERFLQLHAKGDADRLKAKLGLQKVQGLLSSLPRD